VDPLRAKFRSLRSEAEAAEASRYLDLCVEWRLPDGGTLLRAGGVWDRIDRLYLKKDPESARVIRLQPSQVTPAQATAWWFQERAEGRDRDFFSLFLVGDRGSGKTYVAVAALGTACIQFPTMGGKPTIAWAVSQSYRERDELERELAEIFPFEGSWYSHRRAPEFRYAWANGATLRNLSADDPESLKQGRVDFLLYNEAAKSTKTAYLNAIGRLKDQDGLCIATTNPPRSNRGRWVYDLSQKADTAKENSQPYPVRFLQVRSEGNETLCQTSADQIAEVVRDLDPRMAQADVDGLMLPVDQPAYWEWVARRNSRSLPDLGDITRQFLKSRTGREYDYLIGADFQGRPFQVAVVCKIFGSIEDPHLYFCDEILCRQATEKDLANEVVEAGYTPNSAYWIADNSGRWQASDRSKNRYDSHSQIAECGFHIAPCIRPKKPGHNPANPYVEQRVNLINDKLKSARIFVDPKGAPHLAESLKECILKMGRYGRVVPSGIHAHSTDALSYPAWWVYSGGNRKLPGPIAIHGEPLFKDRTFYG
jgi:hypothetical protein